MPELGRPSTASTIVEAVAGLLQPIRGCTTPAGSAHQRNSRRRSRRLNLFQVLGMPLARRLTRGRAPTIGHVQFALVISHGLWVHRLGGRPDIVGQTMTLDGSPGICARGAPAWVQLSLTL